MRRSWSTCPPADHDVTDMMAVAHALQDLVVAVDPERAIVDGAAREGASDDGVGELTGDLVDAAELSDWNLPPARKEALDASNVPELLVEGADGLPLALPGAETRHVVALARGVLVGLLACLEEAL